MDKLERIRASRAALQDAEDHGRVIDSTDMRKALMVRVHSGDITLAEAQAELKSIQSRARAAGKITREQAYNQG